MFLKYKSYTVVDLVETNESIIHKLRTTYKLNSKIVFIPFFQKNHWYLFILEIDQNRCLILNSLKKESNYYYRNCEQVFKFMQFIMFIENKKFSSRTFNFF